VFEHHYRELLNFLARKLNDRDSAADVAQESYVRALTLQQSGELIADPRAMLYRIARNLVVDRHRHDRVRDHDDIDALAETEQPQAPAHWQPEEALAAAQTSRAYVAAIESLPPRCREAFILHVCDELSQAQVAERMGISRSMVEKHIVRGMLACRQCRRRLDDRSEPSEKAGK
jgi:RNA polymerase sigma factor (sigma-70 family)